MDKDIWEKEIHGLRIVFSRTLSDNPLTGNTHTNGWKFEIGGMAGLCPQYTRKEVEDMYSEVIKDLAKRLDNQNI